MSIRPARRGRKRFDPDSLLVAVKADLRIGQRLAEKLIESLSAVRVVAGGALDFSVEKRKV